MKRVPEKDVEQFWKKKEEDIGEKIKGRSMASSPVAISTFPDRF